MAIDTIATPYRVMLKLPYDVKSGTHILSTGNEKENMCQESEIEIDEPKRILVLDMPGRSLNTFIFMINREDTGIDGVELTEKESSTTHYDLLGNRYETPDHLRPGIYINNGKKVLIK